MPKYLKKFKTQAAYEAAQSGLILPNVSLTVDNNTVHYNPIPPETRVVAKYNVISTSSPTPIGYNEYTSGFSAIEIDGVVQTAVTSAYTFTTTGEHTVKYTLTDPTSIGYSAFGECSRLKSIDIPDSVTSISESAFFYCSGLTSIVIPNSVTSIGNSAFWGCSGLTSCIIGSGVTSIGDNAFLDCSGLTSIVIPSGVTNIGISTFSGCISLTSVTIPNSVTSIGNSAFAYCSNLTSIVIPSGVTNIGISTLRDCSSLASITCNSAIAPTITKYTFLNVKACGTLYVPQGSSGYDVWMGTGDYYLGKYNWAKVEQ